MSRESALPERLRYLQPFRKKFAARPPEELNEDTGIEPLFALLHTRIEGHSMAEAEKLLEEDGAALRDWLSAPDQQNDCLHFASVFFSMVSPSELLNQVLEQSKKLVERQPFVEMDLPAGARLRKDKLISWKGLLIALDAVPEEAAASFTETEGRMGAGDTGVEVSVVPVRYGEVVGTKFIRKGESWRGPYKEVCYVLTSPGGHVYASASPLGKNVDESKWDESKLEAYLHTLRVVHKRQTH